MGARQGCAESARDFAGGVGARHCPLASLAWLLGAASGDAARRQRFGFDLAGQPLGAWLALFCAVSKSLPPPLRFEVGDHVFAHGVAFDFYTALWARPSFCCLQRLNSKKGAKPRTA